MFVQAVAIASVSCPVITTALTMFFANSEETVDVALVVIDERIGERGVRRDFEPGEPLR